MKPHVITNIRIKRRRFTNIIDKLYKRLTDLEKTNKNYITTGEARRLRGKQPKQIRYGLLSYRIVKFERLLVELENKLHYYASIQEG